LRPSATPSASALFPPIYVAFCSSAVTDICGGVVVSDELVYKDEHPLGEDG
jgi:hypothetical protein